jgi:hypothetical protein
LLLQVVAGRRKGNAVIRSLEQVPRLQYCTPLLHALLVYGSAGCQATVAKGSSVGFMQKWMLTTLVAHATTALSMLPGMQVMPLHNLSDYKQQLFVLG